MKPPLWIIALIRVAFPSRFFLSRLTRRSVHFRRLIDNTLFRGDHITYLPSPRTIQLNTEIAGPGQLVLPTAAIEHFIGKAKSLFILNTCICRESDSCSNHSIDLGCLFMGEATQQVNRKLGRHVSESEALRHVQKAEEEGLIFLIGRNHIDTLWTGAKPGNRLLTVCFCCQCCCLWKTLPHLADEIADRVHRLPGIRLEVTESCVGCGACTEGVCFAGAIEIKGSRAVINDACRGCGRCVSVCPHEAIKLHPPSQDAVAGLVKHLESLVDVS
jgi:ferredoxin